MTILLLADEGTTTTAEDAKALQRLVKRLKQVGDDTPQIVTLSGYKLYSIPGQIEEVTPMFDEHGNEVIKLDFNAFVSSNGMITNLGE